MFTEDPAYILAANVHGCIHPRTVTIPPATKYALPSTRAVINFQVVDKSNVAEAIDALQRRFPEDVTIGEFHPSQQFNGGNKWASNMLVNRGRGLEGPLHTPAYHELTLSGDAAEAFTQAHNQWLARTGHAAPASSPSPSR